VSKVLHPPDPIFLIGQYLYLDLFLVYYCVVMLRPNYSICLAVDDLYSLIEGCILSLESLVIPSLWVVKADYEQVLGLQGNQKAG
jgi:hypothetical protein